MKKKLLSVILAVVMLATSFSGVYATEEAAKVIETEPTQSVPVQTEETQTEFDDSASAKTEIITADDIVPVAGESYDETDLTPVQPSAETLLPQGFSENSEQETTESVKASPDTGIKVSREEKLAILRERIGNDEIYNQVINAEYIAPTEEDKAKLAEAGAKAKEEIEKIKTKGEKTEKALSYEEGMEKISELRGKESAKQATLTPRKGTKIQKLDTSLITGIQGYSVNSVSTSEDGYNELLPPMYESPYNMYNSGNEAISTQNGSLTYTYPVLSLPGKDGFDLNITLTYNSADYSTTSDHIAKNWSLGLAHVGEYDHTGSRIITLRDGRTIKMVNGEYVNAFVEDFVFEEGTTSYPYREHVITYKDGSRDYFSAYSGNLVESKDAYGNSITYTYVDDFLGYTDERLSSIKDSYDRTIQFTYTSVEGSSDKILKIKLGSKVYAKILIDQTYNGGSIEKIGLQPTLGDEITYATEFFYDEVTLCFNTISGTDVSLLKQINYYTGGCTKFEYEQIEKATYTDSYQYNSEYDLYMDYLWFEELIASGQETENPIEYDPSWDEYPPDQYSYYGPLWIDIDNYRVVSRADYLTTTEAATPKNVVNYYYITDNDLEYNHLTNDYNDTSYVYYTIVEKEDDRNVDGSVQQSVYAFNNKRELIRESIAGTETREFLTVAEFNALNLNLTYSDNALSDYFVNVSYDKHYYCYTESTTYDGTVYEPGIYEYCTKLVYKSEFDDNYYTRAYAAPKGYGNHNGVIYIKHTDGDIVFYEKISTYFEDGLQRDVTEYEYDPTIRLLTKTTQKYRYDNNGNSLYSQTSYGANGDVLTSRAENGNIITYTYPENSHGVPTVITYSYPGTDDTMVITNTLATHGNGVYIDYTVTDYRDTSGWKENYFYKFNYYPSPVYRTEYRYRYVNEVDWFLEYIATVDTVANNTNIITTSKRYSGGINSDYILTSQTYDFNTGLLLSETDGEGLVTTYTYYSDFFDKPDTITAPDGDTTKYVYNVGTKNSLVTIFNNKYYTKDVMDGLGRRISSYDGEYTSEGYGTERLLGEYTYSDNLNNISSMTDGLGNITYYYYADLYNRVTSTMQNSEIGDIINRVEYDDVNRRKTVYNPENEYMIYEYDINGNLVKQYTYLDSAKTDLWQESYTYDVYGNMLTKTDANGNTTTYTYDGWNRVTSCKDATNFVTSYVYVPKGYLSRITYHTYPNSRNVDYWHDSYGNVTRVINQLEQYETYTYDKMGNVKTYTDKGGKTTYYTYNYELEDGEDNYLVAYTLTDSGEGQKKGVKYDYDSFGNVVKECHIKQTYSNGRWTAPTEDYGRDYFTYTYTFDNRLASETHVPCYDEYLTHVNTYTYDVNGNVLSDPNGRYVYDSIGRLIEHRSTNNSSFISYYYNKDGTYDYIVGPNGHEFYSYDKLNRLTDKYIDYASDRGTAEVLTYDKNGNITTYVNGVWVDPELTDDEPHIETVQYTYDKLNRISTESNSDKTTYYTYDSVGNITYKTFAYAQDADITINYDGTVHDFSGYTGISHYQYNTYDAANKLTYKYDEMWYTDTTEWLDNCMIYDYSYTYDTNGNMTKQVADITRNYTYNHINQLVQYSDPNDTVNYIYYPNGLREEKYSANYDSYNYEGLYVIYYYDKDGRIISEGKDAVCWELTTAVNIWGLNGLAKRTTYETTEIEYLSSATEYPITNYRGDILSNFENYINYYDAYGNERRETVSDNPFGYCGEYTDEESGLIYLRNRYYDPTVGRFINEDPARDGLNWYVYCGNNPIRYIDPLGLEVEITKKDYEDAAFKRQVLRDIRRLTGYSAKITEDRKIELVNPTVGGKKEAGYEIFTNLKTSNDTYSIGNGDDRYGNMYYKNTAYYTSDKPLAYVEGEKILETPTFIALGHEMIHALQQENGVNFNYYQPLARNIYNNERKEWFEMEAVGLKYIKEIQEDFGNSIVFSDVITPEGITENLLRKENNIPLRITYYLPQI